MDEKEGVQYGTYLKNYIKIKLLKYNKNILSLTYIATEGSFGTPRRGYLKVIIEAAQQFFFPKEYIEELKSWSEKN